MKMSRGRFEAAAWMPRLVLQPRAVAKCRKNAPFSSARREAPLLRHFPQRQPHPHRRPATRVAFDVYGPLHGIDDVLDDEKA